MLIRLVAAIFALTAAGCGASARFEQHNMAAPLRTFFPRYNSAFFYRHLPQYQTSAAIHFAHGKAHDDLELTPLSRAYYHDAAADASYLEMLYDKPHTEPSMMMFGPYTGQAAWKLYRAIDWTHHHHEMTYDIMSEKAIAWDRKKEWTDRAVDVYLHRDREIARSPAVLDLTMRRAGVLMKPYFGYFRNNYPRANDFFYVAHWWHPVIYEAQMIGGNGSGQDEAVKQTHELTFMQVIKERPLRMLLSRENMPRYARMSPESANIFDNLHMLHGIAYDILAYEGWTIDQKREEIYRVVKAMAYQPGDENFVRKFSIPHPDMDPRVYYPWMKTYEGEMNSMMEEMLREMWPGMSPDGSREVPPAVMEQVRKKLTPGMQEGEIPGSLHDAVKKLVPDMKMDMKAMEPGIPAQKMIDSMLEAWNRKARGMPDVQPISMATEPVLRPAP